MNKSIKVICICSSVGFPVGNATTKRIELFGRSIIEGGGKFNVWHYGTSPNRLNSQRNGSYKGIKFTYLCGFVKKPKNKLLKYSIHFIGIVKLIYKIIFCVSEKKNIYLYVDLQGNALNIIITLLAYILGIKSVQEVNEWWPNEKGISRLIKFQYKNIMFKYSGGAIVISENIKSKILELNSLNKELLIQKVPILADPQEFDISYPTVNLVQEPYIYWCGMIDGYIKDILFIIDAFKEVYEKFPKIKLILSGRCTAQSIDRITTYLINHSILASSIVFTGYVKESDLIRYITNAKLLVLPMWDDERSKTRFPTKLANFSFSSRPIITAPIGEIVNYFCDNRNVLFYKPGSFKDLTSKIILGLEDEELSLRIGINAKKTAMDTFSYKNYSKTLINFFAQLQ